MQRRTKNYEHLPDKRRIRSRGPPSYFGALLQCIGEDKGDLENAFDYGGKYFDVRLFEQRPNQELFHNHDNIRTYLVTSQPFQIRPVARNIKFNYSIDPT